MNSSAIRFRIYKQMLEGNITRHQHDMLLELGIVDKIKGWFGGATEVGGDVVKLLKDKAGRKQLDIAKKNIVDAVKDVRDLSKAAGLDDTAVNQFLQSVLQGADVNPGDVASASSDSSSGGDAGAPAAGAKPGTKIDPGDPGTATPTIVAAAAQAAGQDPQQAQTDAEEKKVTPEKATEVLAKSVAKNAGVEPKAALAVIKALLDGGHMVAEGRRSRRLFLSDVKAAIQELNVKNDLKSNSEMIMERWSHLAGITGRRLLREGRTGDILKDIESGSIKSLEDLEKAIESATADGKGQKVLDRKEEIMAAFKKKVPDVKPEDEKKAEEAIDSAAKGDDKKASPEDVKKAEEAKKKFASAFEDVKTKVGDAADEAAIGKVLAVLDDLDAIKIAA